MTELMDFATRIQLLASKEKGDSTLPLTWVILKEAQEKGASIRQLETACTAAINLAKAQAESTPLCELSSKGQPAFDQIFEELGEIYDCRAAEEKRLELERERRRIWAEELRQAEERFRAQEEAKTPEEREAEEKLWRERFRDPEGYQTSC